MKPRIAVIQRNRNNIPSETVSDYFKKVVTVLFLDYLTTQLNERFDSASVTAYTLWSPIDGSVGIVGGIGKFSKY